jgi:hypothetical protein
MAGIMKELGTGFTFRHPGQRVARDPGSSFLQCMDPGSEAGVTSGSEAGVTSGSEAGVTSGTEVGVTSGTEVGVTR